MPIDKSQFPTEVFHYTSVDGFKGILETGTLFATSINFLSDRKELRFVDDLISESMKQSFIAVFDDVRQKGKFNKDFDHSDVAEKETETFLERLHAVSTKLHPIFVCSFCRADTPFSTDNGLLSQWRGYGSDGGIALCFSVDGLKGLLDQEDSQFEIASGYFGDVIYGKNDREFASIAPDIEMFAKVVPDIVESILQRVGHKYEYAGEKVGLDQLWAPYFRVAPRLKHPGFEEEQEFRISLSVARDNLHGKVKRRKKAIRFRLRGNYLVPYIVINEPSEMRGQLPLTRVIVGPSHEGARREEGVELLLKETGFDVPVKLSEIPFA